jgi:hypothetical protein
MEYIHNIFIIIYCFVEKNTSQQVGPSQRRERIKLCKFSFFKCFKGKWSIIFLDKQINLQKNYQNNLRSNNHEICTPAAL